MGPETRFPDGTWNEVPKWDLKRGPAAAKNGFDSRGVFRLDHEHRKERAYEGPARRFSSIWHSSGASEAALNTRNIEASQYEKYRSLAMRESLGSLYVVLATNLSATVFAASSEFQTQRSPKRESSKRVSYAI